MKLNHSHAGGIIALAATLGCASGASRALPAAVARAPAAVEAAGSADPLAAGIDSIASTFLRDGRVAGFSVAVARGDRITFARGYGWADLEHRVPAGAQTVYRIGSLTKPMTAAAIVQLAEQQRLDLHAPIGRVLPGYPDAGGTITVHRLLNMTSGIPNYTTHPALDYFREPLHHDSTVALFRDRPLSFAPGAQYDYSNSNYYLLGLIIERVAGEPYERHMQAHVVEPLGLEATRYCPTRPVIPHRADGYRVAEGALVNARPIGVAWAFAAGGYCSTVTDQARWIRALSTGQVVSADAVARMAAKTRLTSGVESGYGYGLAVDELGGHRQLSHAGNLDGFQSSLSYFPDDSLAIVVLTNTEDAGASDLKERIARHLLDIRRLTRADVADVPLSSSARRRYVGTYALETVPVRFTITDAAERLQVSFDGQPPVDLLYQGEHRFLPASDVETSFVFTLEGGRATRATVRNATGSSFPSRRVP